MSPTFFVCGATGAQGGAIANHLLQQQANIRTTTRNTDSESAKALQSQGVSIIKGDWDDENALKEGIKGCTGLFLNTFPSLQNPVLEVERARQILNIAKEAGVNHVVYSSAFAIHEPERLDHWDANSRAAGILLQKQAVEKAVRSAGFEFWTIMRPGFFMTNFLPPTVLFYGNIPATGSIVSALTPETLLPLVDPNDIGKFGAAALLEPARFNHAELTLSGELIGVDDIMKALSDLTGRDLKAIYLSEAEIEEQSAKNPVFVAQKMMRTMSQFHDAELSKTWGIPTGNFAEFLERNKEKFLAVYRMV
ncbi:putative NAD dependent epimerase/dehydratase [Aspergillus campestris IBT 28561]|uniref:NAD dependent epimerase/dehydratase n=1 Tax=Aspergillus campestris (strain IBT 28561) TaxID=1392248 RepID=A0A2I1DBS0_ASPC2|nr:putative NAD dependent epimerase/dehydratase [Aspergillus campestris IBT 28561]PKY07327.1 putative NAD dependent epimerase/dehydratase [Aspergillus campestris IBT 28561]